MAKNALVVAGPKLQKALHDLVGTSPKTDLTAAHTPQKAQSVITRMGGESKSPSYNGYFAIKDVSTYNEDGTVKEYRVAVCDGETWDPETEKSGDSTVRLNVNTKPVASTVLSPVARYIYLIYTASSNKIDIMSFDSTKDTDVGSGIYYYLLGEYITSEKRVIQRHTGNGNGEAQIWVVTFTCFS